MRKYRLKIKDWVVKMYLLMGANLNFTVTNALLKKCKI